MLIKLKIIIRVFRILRIILRRFNMASQWCSINAPKPLLFRLELSNPKLKNWKLWFEIFGLIFRVLIKLRIIIRVLQTLRKMCACYIRLKLRKFIWSIVHELDGFIKSRSMKNGFLNDCSKQLKSKWLKFFNVKKSKSAERLISKIVIEVFLHHNAIVIIIINCLFMLINEKRWLNDQSITNNDDRFFGCWQSSLTVYIHDIRCWCCRVDSLSWQ